MSSHGFIREKLEYSSQTQKIEQIGMKYDLTKERIRQIKERAIKRLQKARYSKSLKAYLG